MSASHCSGREVNPPSLDSAAVTARAISRRLRRAGLPISEVNGHSATEGLYAHRVGYSNLVAVGYTLHEKLLGRPTDVEAGRRNDAMFGARDVLSAAGYKFEPNGSLKAGLYIRCVHE